VGFLQGLIPGQRGKNLLVTDVVMPKMNGRQLAESLQSTRPGLKTLYITGHTDDTILRHGVVSQGVPILQKPFTMSGLVRKVREVLEAPR
jgi:two-component system cell cycle sensor histidine kinase/response regulator CckA